MRRLNFGPYGAAGGLTPQEYMLNAFSRIEKWSHDVKTRFDGTLIGSVQALTGSGAIDITTSTTTWNTTGGGTGTLDDGAVGQLKYIIMTVDGGDGVLTPSNLFGGSTITFDAVGDAVTLQFLGTEWHVLSNIGCVIGA